VRGGPVLAVQQCFLEEDAHGFGPVPGDGGGRAAGLGAERRLPEPRRIEPRRPPRVFFSSSHDNDVMMFSPPLQVRRQARPSSLSPPSQSYSIASPPPGGTLMQWTSHQAAAKPRIAGLVIQTQLSVKREVVSGSSQGARPMIKVLALGPGTILSRSQEANTPARPPYEALSLNRQKKL
jgi:hypothetical protein